MSAGMTGACLMVKVLPAGRVQPFPLLDESLVCAPGDAVVVQTENGLALGQVVRTVSGETPSDGSELQVRVVRKASGDDLLARVKQRQRELEAYRIGLIRIRERGLPMKLTRVEQLFDCSRLIFYFTAEGRIDFRELVRDLASEFKMRIEMRQIGVRDEARMLGGYGACGCPLCCASWLHTFEPISIKMAKQQDLTLNPTKLSGLCGRLKCCLRFELPNGNGQMRAPCGKPCSGGAAGGK
jgi:cell fate regulator YaaT (PSP1 superfamily)